MISNLRKRLRKTPFTKFTKMSSDYRIQRLRMSDTGEGYLFFEWNSQTISPWHDIPMFTDNECETLNMIVENLRSSKTKMVIVITIPTFLRNENR